MTIAERIKQQRKIHDVSQEELSNKSGISVKTIQRWESAERSPRIDELQKVSQVLNVPLEDLIVNDNFKIEESAKEIRRNNLQNMAYWGGVLDNAKVAAENNENLHIIYTLLSDALGVIKTAMSQPV